MPTIKGEPTVKSLLRRNSNLVKKAKEAAAEHKEKKLELEGDIAELRGTVMLRDSGPRQALRSIVALRGKIRAHSGACDWALATEAIKLAEDALSELQSTDISRYDTDHGTILEDYV